jgi:hypothetical protein
MKRYTAASILATEFCSDIRDIQDSRYHYGHTSRPVYTLGDSYWCATKCNEKPTSHHSGISWIWIPHKSTFAESVGWQIWKASI